MSYGVDNKSLKRIRDQLTATIHQEFGEGWEVGCYPDLDGSMITVECCDEQCAKRLPELVNYVCSSSRERGYQIKAVGHHQGDRPIVSFRLDNLFP